MTEASMAEDLSLESLVARVADEFRERQGRGERPDVEEYAARHPAAASTLRQVLGSLQLLESLAGGDAPAGDASLGALGDFRIIREIGRGGMGVVYEAEQISLHRRVALKVLPFAATMDPRHLQRFQNEARAAACLHHTNIVPIFAVGCERGVHFYAMQLIDGCTLADAIQGLRRPAESPPSPPLRGRGAGGEEVLPPLSPRGRGVGGEGEAADAVAPTTAHVPADKVADSKADTAPAARQSTLGPARGRDYFRRVAQLGVQAAEALDHAHQVGIVHRDVKPGNLLLDGRGCVWVADFGLAHILHGEANLTMTGDLLGTLRYMSPEQALAQRVPIDHRTDIYSLGATLYELLTLQPAFAGKDRQEVLRQIAFEEPKPPRRITKAIPAELEVIVLKAMSKNPAERYATAQELADDLRRFLDDKPIRARRPSWRKAAGRWARRHRAAVWAGVVCLLVTLTALAGSVGWLVGDRAARQREAEGKVREALEAAQPGLRQGNPWDAALNSAAERATAQLNGGLVGQDLRRKVDQLQKDVRMLAELERIRLEPGGEATAGLYVRMDRADLDAQYRLAFHEDGMDVEALAPEDAAVLVQDSAIREHLAAALDDWANAKSYAGEDQRQNAERLLAIARQADPDPWRNRLRGIVLSRDATDLEQLAQSAPVEELDATTMGLLERMVEARATVSGPMLELLRRAQQRFPADFWINQCLAHALQFKVEPRRVGEAIGFYRAAVALHPQSPGARFNLASCLDDRDDKNAAIAEYKEAIRLRPDFAGAHNNLGVALMDTGKVDEAVASLNEAIRLEPNNAAAHLNLGLALMKKGNLDGAIDEYQEAIRLQPDFANAHIHLGLALAGKGDVDRAIAEYRTAVKVDPARGEAHLNLGSALQEKGRLDEAIDEYQEAVRLWPKLANTHGALGEALLERGRFVEAQTATRRCLELLAERDPLRQRVSRQLQQCDRLIELDGKLPAILSGKEQPANDGQQAEYADVCRVKRLYAAAVRLYQKSITASPDLVASPDNGLRYNAACAAALAGCGQGDDKPAPDEKERMHLRRQALDWLRAELKAQTAQTHSLFPGYRTNAFAALRHWREDADLAGVRGEAALAQLPEAERDEWRTLWADVEKTLAQAPDAAPEGKGKDKP